jgi:hypothetical protein
MQESRKEAFAGHAVQWWRQICTRAAMRVATTAPLEEDLVADMVQGLILPQRREIPRPSMFDHRGSMMPRRWPRLLSPGCMEKLM